jgi:hypothetical protein
MSGNIADRCIAHEQVMVAEAPKISRYRDRRWRKLGNRILVCKPGDFAVIRE